MKEEHESCVWLTTPSLSSSLFILKTSPSQARVRRCLVACNQTSVTLYNRYLTQTLVDLLSSSLSTSSVSMDIRSSTCVTQFLHMWHVFIDIWRVTSCVSLLLLLLWALKQVFSGQVDYVVVALSCSSVHSLLVSYFPSFGVLASLYTFNQERIRV